MIVHLLIRTWQYNLDEDDSEEEKSSCEDKGMRLDGSIISLEFCPLTKGIQISNIPPQTSLDAIKFRFSNPRIGGSEVTDIMFDRRNGVANVFFEESSGRNKIENFSLFL